MNSHLLIAVVGDYPAPAHTFPVVARHGRDLVAFFDFRTPSTERVRMVVDLCRRFDIHGIERVVVGALGCSADVHDWVTGCGDKITSATCRHCGKYAAFDPVEYVETTPRHLAAI